MHLSSVPWLSCDVFMRCVHAIVLCGTYHKIHGSALLSLSSVAMIIKSRKEIIKSILFVIKLMNFYNRSTKIIKSMIIKKKTTTLSKS
jgi:hypothetical protein